MKSNPYQPPAEASLENRPKDLLFIPAVGCLLGSLAALAFAAVFSFQLMRFWRYARELDRPELMREWYEGLFFVVCLIGLVILSIAAAYNMLIRRRRWLVLLAAIVGVTPLGGLVSMPLAALVLMRLRRKDVWNSFK